MWLSYELFQLLVMPLFRVILSGLWIVIQMVLNAGIFTRVAKASTTTILLVLGVLGGILASLVMLLIR